MIEWGQKNKAITDDNLYLAIIQLITPEKIILHTIFIINGTTHTIFSIFS